MASSFGNTKVIQQQQKEILSNIVDASLSCRNSDLHQDLETEYVKETITKFARSHKQILL